MTKQLYEFNEGLFEITKSYSDDNGQRFIEGQAATTDVDLTKEQMSPEVIAKMAAGLINKPLRSEHGKDWDDELGKIIDAKVIDDENGHPALWIKAKLHDWSTKALDLYKLLESGVKKMGLSVAGKIKPGGLVDEFAENLGTWIPTYKDVEPTEVSVTDHPANINTFAFAVTKSLNLEGEEMVKEYGLELEKKDVTNAHATKPAKYKNVPDDKFLDKENWKYPADDAHLMPALRYFNHEGQRSKGGYDSSKWAEMGRKLASFLGDGYKFDASSEKVVKEEAKKSEGGDSRMSALTTDKLSPDVQQFIKDFAYLAKTNSPIRKELEKAQKEQEDELNKTADEAEKARSTSGATSDDSASASSASSAPKSSAKKGLSLSDIESKLTEIASSLESLRSSSLDSTSTTSSDSDSSSDSSSSGSSSSSAEKDQPVDGNGTGNDSSDYSYSKGKSSSSTSSDSSSDSSTESKSSVSSSGSSNAGSSTGSSPVDNSGSSSSSDSDDWSSLESCMNSLGKAQDTLKDLLAKKKKGNQNSASSGSSENDESIPTQSDPHLSKALQSIAKTLGDVTEVVKSMKKDSEDKDEVIKKLSEKVDSIPNERKGKAFTMEKSVNGEGDNKVEKTDEEDSKVEKTYEELVTLMKNDKRKDELHPDKPYITFNDIHKFQMYGTNDYLPKDYREKYTVKPLA